MPISYLIDDEKKRLYSRATGLVTYDDLVEHMRAEFGRPAAAYPEIFDCTGATTDLTAADIRLLVKSRETIADVQEAGPVAIVAPTDLFFGLFRIFDMMTEAIRPISVFRSLAEAEEWLDSTNS
jgi:hypothetical protein